MTELTMNLEPHSSRPMYEQIYEYMKREIQTGGLPFKEKLPSTRKLSAYLQVSRSTVELAYEQLLSEGYIESVPCKGYFVSELEGLCRMERQEQKLVPDELPRDQYEYDFSPNGVDLDSFPHSAWKKLSRKILMDDNKELFMLGAPQGEEVLRKAIARYLHQARGVNCHPSQIIIGAGTDYLLMLLCAIWGKRCRIAMENPTYRRAYRVLKGLSNDMTVVDMDKDGMDVEALEKSGAQVAYVMPSHQYPLGTVMPLKRRMQLLKWAGEMEGRYIIEDDYDSEFRYKGKPIPALQGYDRRECVIYLGTFSKSIAPAIRVSYLVLPGKLYQLYKERGRIFSSTVSRVDQMIIAAFLQEGYFERHLNKMRAVYKSRHDLLLEELRTIPGIRVLGEHAGVHLLVELQNGMTEKEALDRAKQAGIRIYGLSDYYVEPPKIPVRPTVILGYANVKEEEMKAALSRLRNLWK